MNSGSPWISPPRTMPRNHTQPSKPSPVDDDDDIKYNPLQTVASGYPEYRHPAFSSAINRTASPQGQRAIRITEENNNPSVHAAVTYFQPLIAFKHTNTYSS